MSEHKIVPIEPTKEMLEAHRKYGEESPYIQPYETSVAGYYKAMLAAAPPRDQSENERLRAQVEELLAVNQVMRDALQEVDRQLETGFVRCETCGDQEDTKDFDCRTWIADALAIKHGDVALVEVATAKSAGLNITIASVNGIAAGTKLYILQKKEGK